MTNYGQFQNYRLYVFSALNYVKSFANSREYDNQFLPAHGLLHHMWFDLFLCRNVATWKAVTFTFLFKNNKQFLI